MAFAIKDACDVTVYDRGTGKPVFHTSDLNAFNLNLSSEVIYAKSKGANKIAFDGALEGTLGFESEVIQFPQLAMILSSEVVEGEAKVGKRVLKEIDSAKKVILTGITPVAGSISVFAVEEDGKTHIEELGATPSTSGSDTTITLSGTNTTAGTKVVVYYLEAKPKSKKITVNSESKSNNYYMLGYTTMKDEFGINQIMAIKVNNCKPQRNIELALSADAPSTFNTTFDLLPDENGDYFELAFLGVDGVAPIKNVIVEE